MKIGIMQPYFMPYIGYWQLINAVDKYVIYDDVNFIKGGWINRNRILVNGQPKYFNVPMIGASSNKLINEIDVNNNEKLINKNLRIIEGAYQKAPFYKIGYELVEKSLKSNERKISDYIYNTYMVFGKYLEIETELIMSSTLLKNDELKGQDKVLDICKILGATEYFNAIGGKELYSFDDFNRQGIRLKFLKTNDILYDQFENSFQPNLSIIDLVMFNSKEDIQEMLYEFTLIAENKEE